MIPHFTIVIGACKCGTSSLFHYLSEHPQVCAARVKEPNFFASDENLSRGRAWYESLWDWVPQKHETAVEATPAYSVYPVYPNAAKNMARFDATFKLIYCIRDPFEQIASNYIQAQAMSSNWVKRESGWWSGHRINQFFLCCASYAQQLDEYRRYFERDDLLVVDFTDLKRDPRAVLRSICLFIGIDDTYRFETVGTIVNPSAGKVLPRTSWQALGRLSLLRSLYKLFPYTLKRKLYSALGHRLGEVSALSAEDRDYVAQHLRSDWVRLRDTYGIDVSRWSVQSYLQ